MKKLISVLVLNLFILAGGAVAAEDLNKSISVKEIDSRIESLQKESDGIVAKFKEIQAGNTKIQAQAVQLQARFSEVNGALTVLKDLKAAKK